jgi:hypothetical protein
MKHILKPIINSHQLCLLIGIHLPSFLRALPTS